MLIMNIVTCLYSRVICQVFNFVTYYINYYLTEMILKVLQIIWSDVQINKAWGKIRMG